MSIYNYFGYHEGDLSLIRAKLGPNKIVGHVHKTWPTPGEYEVNERTFTWHSASNVEIVGVYILREVGKGFSYKKLPTGKHSGQAKLTAVTGGSTPSLVLQGRHVASAAASRTRCTPLLTGEPCRGPIQTAYSYTGLGGGDLSYLWARPGPEVPLGRRLKTFPPPAYYAPVSKRTFTWHAKPGIEIAAVYVVHSLTRRYIYQQVASGLHSGHATLTTASNDPNPPLLLLEGRHGR
jgi:hypothetical protein